MKTCKRILTIVGAVVVGIVVLFFLLAISMPTPSTNQHTSRERTK